MKYVYLLLIFAFFQSDVKSQDVGRAFLPIKTENTPKWFLPFYDDEALKKIKVEELDLIVEDYHQEKKTEALAKYPNHGYEGDVYSLYYKRWRKNVGAFINEDGTVRIPTKEEDDKVMQEEVKLVKQMGNQPIDGIATAKRRGTVAESIGPNAPWSLFGPNLTRNGGNSTLVERAEPSKLCGPCNGSQ